MECYLCGRVVEPVNFAVGCACLDPRCDGESGDECEPILLCVECL